MSGVIPSSCCAPPRDSREVMTSSKISKLPVSWVHRRSVAKKAGSPGMQPLAPSIGSTSTHAMRSPCVANSFSTAAMSLYWSTA